MKRRLLVLCLIFCAYCANGQVKYQDSYWGTQYKVWTLYQKADATKIFSFDLAYDAGTDTLFYAYKTSLQSDTTKLNFHSGVTPARVFPLLPADAGKYEPNVVIDGVWLRSSGNTGVAFRLQLK